MNLIAPTFPPDSPNFGPFTYPVARKRSDIGTSTCPASTHYKVKSIATFKTEQFISSILHYHCAPLIPPNPATGYEPGLPNSNSFMHATEQQVSPQCKV